MADLEVEKQLAVWVRKERRARYRAIVPGQGSQALLRNSETLDMNLADRFYPSDSAEVVETLRRAGAPKTCYVIAYKLEGEHVDLATGVDGFGVPEDSSRVSTADSRTPSWTNGRRST